MVSRSLIKVSGSSIGYGKNLNGKRFYPLWYPCKLSEEIGPLIKDGRKFLVVRPKNYYSITTLLLQLTWLLLPSSLTLSSSTDDDDVVVWETDSSERARRSTESSNSSKQSSYADLDHVSISQFLISVEAENAVPNLRNVMFTVMWATSRGCNAATDPGNSASVDRQSSGYRVSPHASRITLVGPGLCSGSRASDRAAAGIPKAAAAIKRAPTRRRSRMRRVRALDFGPGGSSRVVVRVDRVGVRRP